MAQPSVPSMQDLLTAGSHFGHKVSRAHPRMRDYIFGARDGISIIDLEKTEKKLKEAVEAAYKLGKEGKVLLIVGTKKQAKEIAESLAREGDTPFMTERWIGGMLTNFDEMRRKIRKLVDIQDEKTKGTLSRYTKREQLIISRKLEKFDREYRGVLTMDKLPDAIFLIDGVSDNTAVKEANRMGITLLGFSDTNADPNWFDYPVPANDDGIKSIKIVCEAVLRAYAQGKKDAGHKTNPIVKKEVAEPETEPKEAKPKKDAKVEDSSDEESEGSKEEPKLDGIEAETAALEELVEKEELEDAERKS